MTASKSYMRWIVLGLIVTAGAVSYLLRTTVSVLGDSMIDDLGLTEIQLGMILSAFVAGYAIFQFPGGLFGEKVGARIAMTACAVAWGVLAIVTAVVPGTDAVSVSLVLGMLIVLRFLTGAVHAPLFPVACGGVISRWFPVGHWGLPNGLSSTGLTLGAAAAGPVLVWLMGSYGWRGAMLITAPIAFVMAFAWWAVVRNDPSEHPRVGEAELRLIKSGRSADDDAPAQKGAWKLVLMNRDILLLTIGYFCMNSVFYLFFNWFFYYLVEVKRFAAQEAGMLMAALWILGSVGATAGGFINDRMISRFGFRWGPASLAGVSLVLSAALLVYGALADKPYVAVAMLGASFLCNQVTEASYWSTAIAVSSDHAAAATGVMNTGGNAVGFVGGMLVPAVAAWLGWAAAMSTGAVFAIIGAILWLFIRGDRPMTQPGRNT